MREIDSRRLQDDTPVGAYLKELDSLIREHDRRKRLAESYFELANKDGSKCKRSEELLCEIGRVAGMADSVTTRVIETSQMATHYDSRP